MLNIKFQFVMDQAVNSDYNVMQSLPKIESGDRIKLRIPVPDFHVVGRKTQFVRFCCLSLLSPKCHLSLEYDYHVLFVFIFQAGDGWSEQIL